MKQSITIDVDVKEGYELKFNPETMTIEQVKKEPVRSKSWRQFCTNHPDVSGEYRIAAGADILRLNDNVTSTRISGFYNNCLTTKEDAEGILALIQLTRLHDEWVGDWKGDYTTVSFKYAIITEINEVKVSKSMRCKCLLDFPTEEMAQEFLDCFKDLIEKAKKFI